MRRRLTREFRGTGPSSARARAITDRVHVIHILLCTAVGRWSVLFLPARRRWWRSVMRGGRTLCRGTHAQRVIVDNRYGGINAGRTATVIASDAGGECARRRCVRARVHAGSWSAIQSLIVRARHRDNKPSTGRTAVSDDLPPPG